jgi:hypothetical protein
VLASSKTHTKPENNGLQVSECITLAVSFC